MGLSDDKFIPTKLARAPNNPPDRCLMGGGRINPVTGLTTAFMTLNGLYILVSLKGWVLCNKNCFVKKRIPLPVTINCAIL